MKEKTRFLTRAALIAAIYVVLTGISYFAGLDKGVIQFRISEALCFLPCFLPAAIPGLSIGCLISNIIYGGALPDIIFGSFATLIGALGTYFLRKYPLLAPIPPIIANALIIPPVLIFAYAATEAYWFILLTVTAGEVLSCAAVGYPLMFLLRRYKLFSFELAKKKR